MKSNNNKHGYKGIGFRKDRNYWRARIRYNGKEYIKYSKTLEECIKQYEELEKFINKLKPKKKLTKKQR